MSKGSAFRTYLLGVFLVLAFVVSTKAAGGYRVQYFYDNHIEELDSLPAGVTVYNACQVIYGESMIEILDGEEKVVCGWGDYGEWETAELTIEILD
jgi:hypothetical protein